MSYSVEELRVGIVDLFDGAAQMSWYPANFHELPMRTGSGKTKSAQAREDARQATAARWVKNAVARNSLQWPYYRCMYCRSKAKAHRCPR